jgi:hypothetical protein
MKNIAWLDKDTRNRRLSSRRSAAMVRIKKLSHQPVTSGSARPASHRSVPTPQQAAPSASTIVNNPNWRKAALPVAISNMMLAAIIAIAAVAGALANSSSAPAADRTGPT